MFVNAYVDFAIENAGQLQELLIQHIVITAQTLAIAIPIGVGLGVYITYNESASTSVLWLASIAMTLPSIALFGIMIPFLGIGSPPVIFALVLYSQLPIIRNTYTGMSGVDAAAQEAGEALGMTQMQKLRKIQLPVALPIILAGIRNAIVIVIGVAAVGAYIGAGGLGKMIFAGIRMGDAPMIVVATLVVTIFALVVDYGIAFIENILRLRNGEDVATAVSTKIWRKVRA